MAVEGVTRLRPSPTAPEASLSWVVPPCRRKRLYTFGQFIDHIARSVLQTLSDEQ